MGSSSSFDLSALNETELYQVARGAGLNPHPSDGREKLISLLEREAEPYEEKNPIDELREGIFHFVDEHWEVLQSQVTCPAKVRNVSGCFGCSDAQVVSCIALNPSMERFIQLRRK